MKERRTGFYFDEKCLWHFGKPFAQVFKGYGYDFYKVDPMLFSPAAVTVTNVRTGRSFTGGGLHVELLDQSFGA